MSQDRKSLIQLLLEESKREREETTKEIFARNEKIKKLAKEIGNGAERILEQNKPFWQRKRY